MMKHFKLTIQISILLFGLALASSASAAITLRPPLNLGLVGYWSMDEGTGTKAGDMSGNGNNGDITGASWINGKRGKALDLNGTSDYVSFSSVPTAVTNNWAMSAWINPSSLPLTQKIAVSNGYDDGGTGNGYAFGVGNGSGGSGSKLEGLLSGVTFIDSGYTFPSANQWYHVVMLRDNGVIKFYVNGTQTANTSASAPVTPTQFWIGSQTGSRYFSGQIDEVRVYNRALSGTEVSALYASGAIKYATPNNKDLVGYWSFEEGIGTKAGDSSGNGNEGDITGASWTTGKRGSALSFDGANDYIDAGNVYNGVKTVSFWLKADTTTNRVIDLNGTAKVELSSGTITTSGITSPTIYVDGVVSSTVDTNWHHITIKTDTGINASAAKLGQGDAWACGDTLTDSRDSKNYATVSIGSQCWMKQGLNVGTRVNGGTSQGTSCASINKWCYSNTDANCDSSNNPNYPDGGLYQWDQMMCGSTTPGVQGICPSGWHLPTDAEICTLEQTVDSSISCSTTDWRGTDGGTKLKPNGSSGWEGNLAGFYNGFFSFYSRTSTGFFWLSTQDGASSAWYRELYSDFTTVYRNISGDKAGGFSVRCVKDSASSTPFFQGKLDEVRMYNRALSGTEIAALYNSKAAVINSPQNDRLTSGLVGLWSFNGPDVNMTTNTAYDRAGSNNGTISGATPTIGKVGQALSFDGNASVNFSPGGTSGILAKINQSTVSAWIKSGLLSGDRHIYTEDESGGPIYFLRTTGNVAQFGKYNGNEWSMSTGSIELATGAWYYIVGVYDSTAGTKLYVNGVADGNSSVTGNTVASITDVGIGRMYKPGAGGNYFNGSIDEVRIYNRTLSAGEVGQLYNMGR